MRTDWKSLVGKKVLITDIFRDRFLKRYGPLQQWCVEDIAKNGICIKLKGPFGSQWYHRNDIKLVDILG